MNAALIFSQTYSDILHFKWSKQTIDKYLSAHAQLQHLMINFYLEIKQQYQNFIKNYLLSWQRFFVVLSWYPMIFIQAFPFKALIMILSKLFSYKGGKYVFSLNSLYCCSIPTKCTIIRGGHQPLSNEYKLSP